MSNESFKDFLSKFSFRPEMAGFIGIEREHFLISGPNNLSCGVYTPRAQAFLETIRSKRWTYELSACQVESRTNPQKDISAIKLEILENENLAHRAVMEMFTVDLVNHEVANKRLFLFFDVYPDPRYLEIVSNISKKKLDAACRVAGTHIHIGSRDINHAIAINNALMPRFEKLCAMGDHSSGERLRLYKVMAENWQPTVYQNPEHFFEVANAEGFAYNPRNCWKLVRISIHGTVELRMFGTTDNIDEILEWVSFVKFITKEAM